jgi:hypothetical protein
VGEGIQNERDLVKTYPFYLHIESFADWPPDRTRPGGVGIVNRIPFIG